MGLNTHVTSKDKLTNQGKTIIFVSLHMVYDIYKERVFNIGNRACIGLNLSRLFSRLNSVNV